MGMTYGPRGRLSPNILARKCLAAPPNGGEARPAYVTRDEPLFTIILRRHHGCVKNQRPLII